MDATGVDLDIIREAGDSFLKWPGIRLLGASELRIPVHEQTNAREQADYPVPLLAGSRPLEPEDLEASAYFGEDSGRIVFCLDMMTDEQTAFGRQLSNTQDESSYIVVYGAYDETADQVCELLDIEVRRPHDEAWFCCRLTPEAREALKQKMDRFCMEMWGEHLVDPPLQGEEGQTAPQAGHTM